MSINMLMQVNVEAPSEHVYVCTSNGMSQYKSTLHVWMYRTSKVLLLYKFAMHSVQVWLREPSVNFVSKKIWVKFTQRLDFKICTTVTVHSDTVTVEVAVYMQLICW